MLQIRITLTQCRSAWASSYFSIIKRRCRPRKLNKPPRSQSLLSFFFRLCFEQQVSFNILQDKASSHREGENKAAPFIYFSIFWVNIASLLSLGNAFHLVLGWDEVMWAWEEQSCKGPSLPKRKAGAPLPSPCPCSQSSAPALAAEGSKKGLMP